MAYYQTHENTMKREELYFELPEDLIAQSPATPADSANMMILKRGCNEIQATTFQSLPHYLQAGDVLVFNNSKVLPSRIFGTTPHGGKVECVLVQELANGTWETIINATNNPLGKTLSFHRDITGVVEARDGQPYHMRFNVPRTHVIELLKEHGTLPTPPYIKTPVDQKDYQTIFASDHHQQSAAAPTAGLHFTHPLIDALVQKGIQIEYVTLHVGLGTFQPIIADPIENHRMHYEHYEVSKDTAQRIAAARKEGRRIIAVGTTSCRVLESIDTLLEETVPKDIAGETNLFITPGYSFQVINGLITNFHTPYSSLLALVMSFAGTTTIEHAYQYAINNQWKFYSLGDGMLITT